MSAVRTVDERILQREERAYEAAFRLFDAEAALAILGADAAGGSVNAAEICCERHARDGERIALRHVAADGRLSSWTFAHLQGEAERVSRLFASLGVGKGSRVAGLLPRTPELLITILATWRLGAVYLPLFTAFGPKAIEYRLAESDASVVVTNAAQIDKLGEGVAIVTVDAVLPSQHDFWADMNPDREVEAPASCTIDDPFLIMFTSGTTGLAKPLLVPIRAIAAFVRYMVDAVDLREEDVFWNVADPGWAYGLYYAITAPLALGYATTFVEAPFTAESAVQAIQKLGISNLAGSPTAFRMLMAADQGKSHVLRGRLRAVSSAGEPLNPEIIRWFATELGSPIYDHYGQTELGMVLCNHHGLSHPVHIGSAGFPSPGHHLVILNEAMELQGPGVPGILALDRSKSPLLWFTGYLARPTEAFVDDYYLTGDTCELNVDGSISFVGRADDVITTSGYRVGPFDVESALLEHPAVVESAVIGKPDPERTEIIKAFVVLSDGYDGTSALAEDLRLYVRRRLSAHAYPREIEFVAELPKTPSGKLQRFLLRNQEITRA